MRAVVTRVRSASVAIDGRTVGAIGQGFLLLLGVAPEDTPEICRKAAIDAIERVGTPNGFIPCISQGGPGSVYPGTYKELWDAIDDYNCKTFGLKQEDLEAARLPMDILF